MTTPRFAPRAFTPSFRRTSALLLGASLLVGCDEEAEVELETPADLELVDDSREADQAALPSDLAFERRAADEGREDPLGGEPELAIDPRPVAAASVRTVSIGRSWNLGQSQASEEVDVPTPQALGDIVGMGISAEDNVYTWYADGTVTRGTSRNLSSEQGPLGYVVPDGRTTSDIIAIDIAPSNDRVFTWYRDGRVSQGWSRDLGAYSPDDLPQVTLPSGKTIDDVVGIAIASDDHVYVWYSDGTVSEGTSTNFAAYEQPYAYAVPSGKKIGHIIDTAINSNDMTYTWYHDVEIGSAHAAIADELDARVMDVLRRSRLPGVTVAVSKNGRVVAEKAYGYANFPTSARMQIDSRSPTGSTAKVIAGTALMHVDQNRADFSVTDPVYGPDGVLTGSSYTNAQDVAIDRYTPIVAKAIAPDNNHVFTWYHDGTVTEGTSTNPDAYGGAQDYEGSLPSGIRIEQIRAIAFDPATDNVRVWYEDGTYSAGTPTDFEAALARDPDDEASAGSGHSMLHVIGVGISSVGRLYAWFEDGTVSQGTFTDFDAVSPATAFTTAPGKSRYRIAAISIGSQNDRTYAWYSDGTVSHGWSQNLASISGNAVPFDIPASAYDPNKDWDEWFEDMRVTHLLSHSAGFTRSGDVTGSEWMFGLPETSLGYDQVHRHILQTRKLYFAPGTRESYSNHGAGLVGHLVAVLSGTSYRDYVETNILAPLDLDDRILPLSTGPMPGDAATHTYSGNDLVVFSDIPQSDLGLGSGGWKASAGDLVRFMLATDRNPNHPDILSVNTLNAMETRPFGASSYALSWDTADSGQTMHKDGAIGGGNAYMIKFGPDVFPGGSAEPITVAICTNIDIASSLGGMSQLVRLARSIAAVVDRESVSANYDLF